MAQDRRDDDDKVVHAWRKFNPYFHVIGFIILCTFIATTKYGKFDAYGDDITDLQKRTKALEEHYARIDVTLQDFRDFFKIPHIHRQIENHEPY